MVLKSTVIPSSLSLPVMKREFVSWRNGVRSSEPTAMISAFTTSSLNEWKGPYAPGEMKNGIRGGQNCASGAGKRQPNQTLTSYSERSLFVWRDFYNAALACQGRSHIKVSLSVKSQALRTPESLIKDGHSAVRIHRINRVKTGSGWPGHVQRSIRRKSQMIRRHAGLQRGVDQHLLVASDAPDGPAPVADIQILSLIKSNPGSYAHAFSVGA